MASPDQEESSRPHLPPIRDLFQEVLSRSVKAPVESPALALSRLRVSGTPTYKPNARQQDRSSSGHEPYIAPSFGEKNSTKFLSPFTFSPPSPPTQIQSRSQPAPHPYTPSTHTSFSHRHSSNRSPEQQQRYAHADSRRSERPRNHAHHAGERNNVYPLPAYDYSPPSTSSSSHSSRSCPVKGSIRLRQQRPVPQYPELEQVPVGRYPSSAILPFQRHSSSPYMLQPFSWDPSPSVKPSHPSRDADLLHGAFPRHIMPQGVPQSSRESQRVIAGDHGSGVLLSKYECNFCGKGFNRPSSLKIHLNSHTGEKPFVCPVDSCGRSFSVLSNMRRHARVHNQNTLKPQESSASDEASDGSLPPIESIPPAVPDSHHVSTEDKARWQRRRDSSLSLSSTSSRRSRSISQSDDEIENAKRPEKRTRH